jgi:hypothetical protein
MAGPAAPTLFLTGNHHGPDHYPPRPSGPTSWLIAVCGCEPVRPGKSFSGTLKSFALPSYSAVSADAVSGLGRWCWSPADRALPWPVNPKNRAGDSPHGPRTGAGYFPLSVGWGAGSPGGAGWAGVGWTGGSALGAGDAGGGGVTATGGAGAG